MIKKQETKEAEPAQNVEKVEKAPDRVERPRRESRDTRDSGTVPAVVKEIELSVTAPLICMSCKKRITNDPGSVKFMCPNCGKYQMIRCRHCRQIVAKYTCPACGFVGPN